MRITTTLRAPHGAVALLAFLLPLPVIGQPLEVYFNKSVDTTLARPAGNVARGNVDLAAVAAREIAAAVRSVDVAMYNLSVPRVVDALIAAKRRGVRVRVIGHRTNVSNAASRFSQLQANGIPVLASPEGAPGVPQPLMHNKFILVDVRPADTEVRPVVITGSWNATTAQTVDDPNNVVVVRDSLVAKAYLTEFEEMWGSTGNDPAPAAARFGAAKTDNTPHTFTLSDGTRLDVYFSPTDGTESKIRGALATGQTSILTANLTVTSSALAQQMNLQKNRFGADVRSIVDNTLDSGSQFTFLRSFADALEWTADPLLHHKYAAIDALPLGTGSFPIVVTGSHNWTYSANAINDENTLIIYSATVANLFLQEFAARYAEAGGARPFVPSTRVAADEPPALAIWPVPFGDRLVISGADPSARLELVDALGRTFASSDVTMPSTTLSIPPGADGVYVLRVIGRTTAGVVVVRGRGW